MVFEEVYRPVNQGLSSIAWRLRYFCKVIYSHLLATCDTAGAEKSSKRKHVMKWIKYITVSILYSSSSIR